jgi:MFS family permease
VNGTFWIGGAVGSLTAIYLLSGKAIGGDHSWRFAFGIGGLLGVVIFLLRLSVQESPRWLMLRGQEQLADELVSDIEAKASRNRTDSLTKLEGDPLKIKVRDHTSWREIFSNMLGENRQRTYLGLILMVAQAFFFNAVFFSYGLVGKTFFHITDRQIPWHLLPFTIASFLGPLSIGRLFDTVGRKKMIAITYGAAGLLLAGTTIPFATGHIGAKGVGICFSIIFFIASSAASAAYLTVSEIFPLELRAFAIAVSYALGTLVGGVAAPWLFGLLIQTHSRTLLALGYGLGALLMVTAAICEPASVWRPRESHWSPYQSRSRAVDRFTSYALFIFILRRPQAATQRAALASITKGVANSLRGSRWDDLRRNQSHQNVKPKGALGTEPFDFLTRWIFPPVSRGRPLAHLHRPRPDRYPSPSRWRRRRACRARPRSLYSPRRPACQVSP